MKSKNLKTINITTDEDNPMPVELVAESIKSVADNMGKVLKSGLTMKAICILIQSSLPSNNRIGIKDIELILSTTSNLSVYIDKDVTIIKEKKPVSEVVAHTGTVDEMIKAMCIKALAEHKTNKAAAKSIGLNERTFYRYKQDFGI